MAAVHVVPATPGRQTAWCRLRQMLWAETSAADHVLETAAMLAGPDRFAAFLAVTDEGDVAGFAEASLRFDYVNGCETSPVAFLEGIFVAAEFRRRGMGSVLVAAVADWAREKGVGELASDADIANQQSIALHGALGFSETERVVCFRKLL